MPETPDFDLIAEQFVRAAGMQDSDRAASGIGQLLSEQLRRIWNVRGAADLVTLEAELAGHIEADPTEGFRRAEINLDSVVRMLRSLDR